MAGNVYPSQANANRNTPLASQRGAQNGKLGRFLAGCCHNT